MGKIKQYSKTFNYYQFEDLVVEVDKKLKGDQRDCGNIFYPDTTSFENWHKSKKYPQKDSEGKTKGSSQIWFAEYKKDIELGKIKEVPYLDFWHYQIDHCFLKQIINDSFNDLYIGLDKELLQITDDNDWRFVIQKIYYDLFHDLADSDGYICVYISW